MNNDRILVISDLHAPYMHQDTVKFLTALKKKYNPTRILSTGDEGDYHALSYHEHDPDASSPGDELKETIDALKPLYTLFPRMDILDSNHGSLVYRKALTAGIPNKFIKPLRDVLGAPKGWNWYASLKIKLPNGQDLFCHHGLSKSGISVAREFGCCFLQGHHHTSYELQYTSSPTQLYWAMTVGCMINDKARAFAYNKLQTKRPILGCAIIENSLPRLLPMILNKNSRWTGQVP